jgi:serine/threonine-protein kinase
MISLLIGKHEYRFDEDDIIGEGAMGTVYRGYEVNSGRPVAVKRVHDELADNQRVRQRAHLEGDLGFTHSNLVEMLGYCEDSPYEGPIFLVSGYVDGEIINKYIAKSIGSLHLTDAERERRICEMFLPVLDALAFLHSHDLRHLDIKPSNIMVENGRNVRLMDLGIVDSGIDHHGIGGRLIGTPRFAAPEQFADSAIKAPLTTATDIYQAGVTLYTLLTDTNPFSHDIAKACKEHQTKLLPPAPHISQAILTVVRKAANPKPDQRYQSANEMKMALVKVLYQNNIGTKRRLWPYFLVFGAIAITVFFMLLLAVCLYFFTLK